MSLDVLFRGLSAPLRLTEAPAVLPILSQVAAGWPHVCRPADLSRAPFFTITDIADSPLLLCQSHMEAKPARQLDPVNAVCDAMAALALALPAEDARLICLHAAGVEMAGRLVVFPSVRRAGKSTLSVALARSGHLLYGDDVLPLSVTDDNLAFGHAMGIAPRLRLPLPESFPEAFRDWVATVEGPANRQYAYLPLAGLPPQGSALPIGAFVILDRQEGPSTALLSPVSPDVAMDALLFQNFTRDRHSGDILQAMASALSALPVFRLSYSDLADAVACLEAAFAKWPDAGQPDPGPMRPFRLADFASPAPGHPLPGAHLSQRPWTVPCVIGDTLYLADAEGRAIHRMDALATAIWEVLAEPASATELEDMLTEAFPDTDRSQIKADLFRLLGRLHSSGLIASA